MARHPIARFLTTTLVVFSVLAARAAATPPEPEVPGHAPPPTPPTSLPGAPAPKPKLVTPAPPPIDSISIVREDHVEPDLEACVGAFLTARSWLVDFALPDAESPASSVPVPGVRGVCAILRHNGRVVGIGEDWPGGGAGDDRMVRRALSRAVAHALGDRVISALPKEFRDSAGAKLALEMEFAGRPEALVGRTFAECATRIEPGLDGIALRRGGGEKATWAVAFPARLNATNSGGAPERTIVTLVVDAGLQPKDLPDLARSEPVGVFRFATLRLAQPTPETRPMVRGRGFERVTDAEITAASVRAHAWSALEHLMRTRPDPADPSAQAARGSGIAGNYAPVADDFRPLVAPPLEQALTAWAAATLAMNERFDARSRAAARAFASALLDDLAMKLPDENSPSASAPAMTFTLCAVGTLGHEENLPQNARDFAALAREKLGAVLSAGAESDKPLVCLASAMTLETEQRVLAATDLRATLDETWKAIPKEQLIGQFSWMVLAEAEYARVTGEPLAHVAEARTVARLLLAVQNGFGNLLSDRDLRGGFRLLGERRNGVTSQSLRPGFGLTIMTAVPNFVEADDAGMYRERTVALLRFAQELTIDDAEALYFRNPGRAAGGIRAALWDSNEPVAATAMAILVDCYALEILDRPDPRTAGATSLPNQPVAVPGSSPASTPPRAEPAKDPAKN